MPAVAQEPKAHLGHIDQVDRIEPHVTESEEKRALMDDARRLAQVLLHEARRPQMRPCEAGFLEVLLDFPVHAPEDECGLGLRCGQTGELDYVLNARGLGRIHECGLRLDHVHPRGGDHEDSIDAVQGRAQGVAPGHVALDDLDRRDSFEGRRLRPVPYQDPYGLLSSHEFVHYEGTGRTGRTCKQFHHSFSLGWST